LGQGDRRADGQTDGYITKAHIALDIRLQPTTHFSTLKGWKAELAYLADL